MISRYNVVMKYVEYQSKEKPWYGYMPVEPRVQKRMTLEVQLADIRVSIKDVRNFLESDYIQNYDPISDFLQECNGKWDGKDHIRELARTVPTSNPHWEDWFYTWFLAMVSQWQGTTFRQYGNSVAPLLISRQDTTRAPSAAAFCRRNFSGATTTTSYSLRNVRCIRQCRSFCLSISTSSIRFHPLCSRGS